MHMTSHGDVLCAEYITRNQNVSYIVFSLSISIMKSHTILPVVVIL